MNKIITDHTCLCNSCNCVINEGQYVWYSDNEQDYELCLDCYTEDTLDDYEDYENN